MTSAPSIRIGTIWTPGLMSSVRQDWATPWKLYELLNREFRFTLDVCAVEENAKAEEWFASDALSRPWVPVKTGAVWCNPPYGRTIGKWVEKGYRSSKKPYWQTVIMLLPSRTDTQWFHEYCLKGEVRFLRGRLNFDDTRRARAPFPSIVVVFRPEGMGECERETVGLSFANISK